MPTATPFISIGKGNGFPFCPTRVNLDGQRIGSNTIVFEHWITLGGYKKTDTAPVTQGQIDLSLTNAMKLFWNFYKLQGLAEATYSSGTTSVTETPSNDYEPYTRVCETSSGQLIAIDNPCFLDASHFSLIRRFYVGGEFVGYGGDYIISGPIDNPSGMASARGIQPTISGGSIVKIASAIAAVGSYDNVITEVKYTELEGIPILCYAAAANSEEPPSHARSVGTLNAGNLSASSTFTNDNTPSSDRSSKAEITSLEFYSFT